MQDDIFKWGRMVTASGTRGSGEAVQNFDNGRHPIGWVIAQSGRWNRFRDGGVGVSITPRQYVRGH